METEEQIGLYYPYIDITDDAFLKTSALYWDKLYTIVPSQIETPYRTEMSIEAHNKGFLEPLTIEDRSDEVNVAGLEIAEDFDNIDWDAFPDSGKPIRIYKHKISKDAISGLENLLGKRFDYVSSDMIALPENIAHVYMSRLASVIANNDHSIPITNISNGNRILTSRFIDYSQEHRENQGILAQLSLQSLAINPDVPLDSIFSFRDKNRDKLSAYRKKISILTDGISKGFDSVEKMELFQRTVKNQILPEIKNMEDELKRKDNIFMVTNAASTITSIIIIICTGGHAWLLSLINSGLNVGLQLYGNYSDNRAINKKTVAYLYEVRQTFGVNKGSH